MSSSSRSDESFDLRLNIKSDKTNEQSSNNSVSGQTFLKFLSAAYHLNETIEGVTKDLGLKESIGKTCYLSNVELFANLLDVEHKCIMEVAKEIKSITQSDKACSSDTENNTDKSMVINIPCQSVGFPLSVYSSVGHQEESFPTGKLLLSAKFPDLLGQSQICKNEIQNYVKKDEVTIHLVDNISSLSIKDETNRQPTKNLSLTSCDEYVNPKGTKSDHENVSSQHSDNFYEPISLPIESDVNCILKTCTEPNNVGVKINNYFSVEQIIKNKLTEVLQEGVLDSVLPYLTAKYRQINVSCQHNSSRKTTVNVECRKSSEKSSNAHSTRESRKKSSSSEDSYKTCREDIDVEIHVCDEAKNLKKDFRCSQKLLVSKMGYFAEVTTGQKLQDMDISVHCDINIFEWLMKWVKKDLPTADNGNSSNTCSAIAVSSNSTVSPTLDAINVVPILVSASFLQMDPLLDTCLQYCKNYMNEILKSPANLSCLNDGIFTRLADTFSNVDVEALKDKKDKIRSRLYCKLIVFLCRPEPDTTKGHYSSFADVYRCIHCAKLILPEVSINISCIDPCLRISPNGKISFLHERDPDWSITEYIEKLKIELRCWRRVYWRMWADCHFLYCLSCRAYYSLFNYKFCFFHPDPPQFFSLEQQRSMAYPVGRYPCCGLKAYRFESVQPTRGCKMKKHVPKLNDERSLEIVRLFNMQHSLIFTNESSSHIETSSTITKSLVSTNYYSEKKSEDESIECQSSVNEEKKPEWWEGIRLQIVSTHSNRGLLVQGLDMTKDYAEVKLPHKLVCDSNVNDTNTYTSANAWHTAEESNDDMSDPDEGDDYYNQAVNLQIGSDISQQDDKYRSFGASNASFQGNKTKKLRGNLPKTQWVTKFSTRYNQDNQRDYEERAFQSINSMLSHRVKNTKNCADRLSVFDSCDRSTIIVMPSGGSVDCGTCISSSSSYHSFSSYCSTLSNKTKTIPSRMTLFWSSHIPLGGTYVKMENEWKECHSATSMFSSNSNLTNNNNTRAHQRNTNSKFKMKLK